MSTIITREFSFSRDFRKIQWGSTLWYNLLRAACAGLIIGTLMFIFPQSAGDRTTALAAPLIWPAGYLIVFLPMGLVLSMLSFVPFAGLFSIFLSFLTVAIGDPIVCLIKKAVPPLVPVEEPSLFSMNMIIFVLDAEEITIAS